MRLLRGCLKASDVSHDLHVTLGNAYAVRDRRDRTSEARVRVVVSIASLTSESSDDDRVLVYIHARMDDCSSCRRRRSSHDLGWSR